MKAFQLLAYLIFFVVTFFSIFSQQNLLSIYFFLMAWSAAFYFMNSEKISYDKYKLWQDYYKYIPVTIHIFAILVLIVFLCKKVLVVL